MTSEHRGSGYALQVTSNGLAPAVTGPLDVIPPPVTILGVSMKQVPAGKHKTTMAIVVQFSGPLNPAAADNLAAYTLATVAQGKRHPSNA